MGLVLSFLMGSGILRILSGGKTFKIVDFFLSWGLGVGLASQITFFSILIGGRHRHETFFFLVFVAAVLILTIFLKKKMIVHYERQYVSLAFFLIVLFPLIVTQIFIYKSLPFGDWDAWSLWNYRANSLFRSAGDWLPVYHNAIQGKHPWLLVHYIDWGWFFLGKEVSWVPALTALLMSVATVGLVVFALLPLIGRFPAMLAGTYLISIPFFNWHAASQYASIFVAFYLLGSVVAIREYLKEPSLKYAVVAGSFLAFLANSKDEGVLLTVLVLFFLYGFFKKQNVKHQKGFQWAFLLLMAMFVLTEIFMRLSLGLPFVNGKYYGMDAGLIFDAGRWKVFTLFLGGNILANVLMGGIFYLFMLFLLSHLDKKIWKDSFLGLQISFLKVIAMFLVIFLILYITATTNLKWRLEVTAYRLMFIFLPTLVYMIFGVLYKNEER